MFSIKTASKTTFCLDVCILQIQCLFVNTFFVLSATVLLSLKSSSVCSPCLTVVPPRVLSVPVLSGSVKSVVFVCLVFVFVALWFLRQQRQQEQREERAQPRMSRGDIQQRQQDYLCYYSSFVRFFTTTDFIFYDNRDNRNNGKNGRNCGCHEVTYNRDNKITVVNSFFFASCQH